MSRKPVSSDVLKGVKVRKLTSSGNRIPESWLKRDFGWDRSQKQPGQKYGSAGSR